MKVRQESGAGKLVVCFTSPYSFERMTGIGRFVRDLERRLRDRGMASVIVSPGAKSTSSLPNIAVSLHMSLFANAELAFKSALVVLGLRRRYEVIHAQHAHLQSAAVCFVGRILGKPSVLTLHGLVPSPQGLVRRIAFRLTEALSIRLATRVVAVSPFVADAFGHDREGIQIIPNGVDVDNFKPSPEERVAIRRRLGIDERIVFLYAGRWASTKGVGLLLEAVASISSTESPLVLLLMGEPSPDEPGLVREASLPPEARSHVKIVGRVDAPLSAYLAAGDVFVLPSAYEGLPLALLEAMAVGLPCLVSDIPINRTIVNSAHCGWVFRSGDVNALARAMADIVTRGVPKEMSQNARQAVIQFYNLDQEVASYLAVYSQLDSRRRRDSCGISESPPQLMS